MQPAEFEEIKLITNVIPKYQYLSDLRGVYRIGFLEKIYTLRQYRYQSDTFGGYNKVLYNQYFYKDNPKR